MSDFAAIFLGACLVNNLILDSMLGLPPAIVLSRKIETATGMGLTMMIALTVTTVITWPFYFYVLVPAEMENLTTFSFILLIIPAVKGTELVIRKIRPELHEKIAVFIPLTLVNSSALGVALINILTRYGVIGSLFFGIGSAAGFALIMIALSAMQERIMETEVPAPFRGIAITLITLGIMSMAFMGFTGMVGL